jgi:hypothetical protein
MGGSLSGEGGHAMAGDRSLSIMLGIGFLMSAT